MYVGIDIGGTKTLVAALDDNGVIVQKEKFPTPQNYDEFLAELEKTIDLLKNQDFTSGGIGVPGLLDRENGIALAFGNLAWKNVPILSDIEKFISCPLVMENDAKLAALSEAMLLKNYRKVLYITISTGIGIGVIVNQKIDETLKDAEGGQMWFTRGGKPERWETFASGKAIKSRYGKEAHEIDDPKIWQEISADLALGIVELTAVVQPDVIVLGGGVGRYYDKFAEPLDNELKRYNNPLMETPPIRGAQRPDEAVIYGCYDLAKQVYGRLYNAAR